MSETSSARVWYAATLVFSSTIGRMHSLRPLCEERVVLFHAQNQTLVERMATAYGAKEAHSYENNRGEIVNWTFLGVEKIEELSPEPASGGWEVASRFVRRSQQTLRTLKGRDTGARRSTKR